MPHNIILFLSLKNSSSSSPPSELTSNNLFQATSCAPHFLPSFLHTYAPLPCPLFQFPFHFIIFQHSFLPEFDFWLRITLPSASAPHRTSQHLIQGALTLSKNHPHNRTFLLLQTILVAITLQLIAHLTNGCSTSLPQHGTLPTLLVLLLTSVPHALFATYALLPGHLYEISHTKL